MNLPVSGKRGYSDRYLNARARVDDLCRRIVVGGISTEQAMKLFEQIEDGYSYGEPEHVDLFKMIYRSRVVRLADQFSGRD